MVNKLPFYLSSDDAWISGLAKPKIWEWPNISTLSEQQYLVWDTASRNTKQQDMPKFWGDYGPLATPICLDSLSNSCSHLW